MTLNAGPELDAAVAKACGIEGEFALCGVFCIPNERNRPVVAWSPSTDLNAAFEAAEKCGLWPDHYPWSKLPGGKPPLVWRIVKNDPISHPLAVDPVVSEELTLPLAICAAILALKGKE